MLEQINSNSSKNYALFLEKFINYFVGNKMNDGSMYATSQADTIVAYGAIARVWMIADI